MRLPVTCSLFLLIGVLGRGRLPAQESAPPPSDAPAKALQPAPDRGRFWTTRRHFNFGLQVAYGLESDDAHRMAHINLLYAQPQLGIKVADFHAPRLPLSRLEMVNEGLLGNAIHPGGRMTGYVLLFRLDGHPRRGIVPFFDLGAGVLNTKVNRRAPELSGHTQFNPQAGMGIQYFFRPQRALVFEYRYFHISNNNIQPPNLGFNGSMLTVGFRWLLRPGPRTPQQPRHSRNPARGLFRSG
jgi:hypothetical protein